MSRPTYSMDEKRRIVARLDQETWDEVAYTEGVARSSLARFKEQIELEDYRRAAKPPDPPPSEPSQSLAAQYAKSSLAKPYLPKPTLKNNTSRVLVIPDLHCPFEHPDALAFLQAVQKRYETNKVVCMGDEVDMHAISRWPSDPDGMSAGKELQEAINHLAPFYHAFPEVLVCESNHTIRGHKKSYDAGLPSAFLRSIETVLQCPDGWRYEQDHTVDGVFYTHGDPYSGKSAHMKWATQKKQSVVIGHVHSHAGVQHDLPYFGMNAGCLIDPPAYAFSYAKKMPVPVSLGCGVVIDGKAAFFIPMETKDGRWTGQLSL